MLNIKYYIFIILSLLMILDGQVTSVADVTAVGERTSQVRDTIVSAAGVNTADQVTETHLAAITELNLRNAGISELQTGDFSGLTGLTNLNLYANQLSHLPAEIFHGLTALTTLRLGGNTVDPLPLTIGLEKVAEGKLRAVVLEGAPFDIVLPISVTNGILTDNVTMVTIPKGSMVSETITVSAIPLDTRENTTVNIGDPLPSLPHNHYGYVLSKSNTLPIVAIIGNVPPVFSDGTSITVSVDENTETDTNIGNPITATDMDAGDTLIYSLGGIDADAFNINPETGQLKTKGELDYETKFFYSVTITVYDGLLTDTITVTINVIDVLDNFAPTFTEGAITVRSIAENTEADENIGIPVTAVDTVADVDNAPDTITYSLGGIDAASFDIDTETGQLKTKASLDFERKPLYVVKVIASDGDLTDMITVIIRLIDLVDTDFIPVSLPLSERTPQVRNAIVDSVAGLDLEEITDAHIAAITTLNLRDTGITKLKTGDFSGMPNLSDINLHNNMLTGLPAGIFEGLTSLNTLRLGNNLLNPLPIFVSIQQVDTNQFQVFVPTGAPFDIVVPIIITDGNISGDRTTATVEQGTLNSETFTIVPTDNLITPIVDIGKLPGLPQNHYGYVLARSTACNRTPEVVSAIEAMYPLLMHCQNVADVDLAVITKLNLDDMGIRSLRTSDFFGMLALTTLYLNNNELTEIPDKLFNGLVSLKTVSLRGNKLTHLPDGIFEGFVSLKSLDLSSNEVDPIPLTVSLEKVGEHGLKAVFPTGAPFDITLTPTVTNGTITDTITIPQGSVESNTYTITRIPNTLEAVTVDISELPDLPALHAGYELIKLDAVPLEIFPRINVAPVFTQTTPTTHAIPENTEEGINIGTAITALDANNDMLTYTLSGEDAESFEIDPDTGQLTTKEDLDFETKFAYTVIVSATDGVNAASITVTINVTDVNENRAPIFTEGSSTARNVEENTTAGTNIGDAVVATDPDDDTFTYSLDGTDAASFSLDTETGQLRTEAPLDYETKNSYAVIITASDGELTASIDVVINVTDIEENPPVFTQGTTTTITITTETEQAITATDADGDTLTYSLSGNDAELFDIDPDTGELGVKEGVTLEPDKTYMVTVTVSDDTHITSIDVNINIPDKNDETVVDKPTDQVTQTPNNTPVFTEGSTTTRSVQENTEIGVNIGEAVTATDNDNDTLIYTLSGTDAGSFSVDNYTGQLQTSAALDYEIQSIYSVTITVTDEKDRDSIDVTINVTDVDETTQDDTQVDSGTQTQPPPQQNRAPVFSEGTNTTRSVPENTTAETNIGGAVAATDPDDDTLTYSLDGTDAASFSIDNTTGQLKTKAPLDYETNNSYSVIITASDGELTASIDVIINVIDVEENPPVFTQGTTTTITITTETEQVITATDADGDTLTYSISGDDAELFDIDPNTAELKVKEGVTLDPDKTYMVTVTVSDGTHITSIDVNINISDKDDETLVNKDDDKPTNQGSGGTGQNNDDTTQRSDVTDQGTQTPNNTPVFTEGSSTTRSVPENTETGENIGDAVTATDADNDTLTYTLSGTDASSFSVDNNTGQLQTRVALDYETQSIYSVTISVTDGKDRDSIDVTINVTDIDETTTQDEGTQIQNTQDTQDDIGTQTELPPQQNRAPVFSEGTTAVRYVAENIQVGTNVGTPVSATDQDAGDTLTYRLGTSGDATAFSINTNTGQLITSAVFDYETKSSYSITVIVSDGEASDTIGITINVTNDNDPPVFTPGYRTRINVRESVSIGRELSTYTATDQDSSDTLIYSLSSNNNTDHNAFEIDDDGILKTSTTLDYETKNLYVVIVSVSDGNNGTDSITVSINVRDVIEIPNEIDPPISSRTPAVRNAIVAAAGVESDGQVTPEDLANIKDLDLNRRAITSLSAGDFNGLIQLRQLDLGYNDFTSLPEGIFDELPALETLFMRYGSVSSLPPGLFDNTTKLKLLGLDNNDLSSLPAGLFDNLTNLRMLILPNNDLSSLPAGLFDNLTNLKLLWLYDNDLSSLPAGLFDNLTNLEQLLLYDNDLSSLPSDIFDNLTNLEELRLDNNDLSSLPSDIFDNLTNLELLWLYDNDLSSLPSDIFDNLTNLEELRLDNNDLSSLPPDIFDNLAKLEYLDLDHNKLSSLPSGIFNNLVKLQLLYLEHNRLSSLPPGTCNGLFELVGLRLLGNLVDPMLFTVSLEKVDEGKVKAVIPLGAPYDVVVYIKLEHGTNPDPKVLRISTGMNESSTFTVTRTPGTTEAVTVDIFHIVVIPAYYHTGYEFVKPSTGLPVEIYAAGAGAPAVIEDATPSTTTLMSNYPNPFNPETWLPYQLSKASNVTITIYNMRGVVVRRLALGHQKAGFYTSRHRAAHWDGRNTIGEKVASGVYFYTFKAGDFTATRKMLIRK